MASPRTRRYSRPCNLCSLGCGLRGVRDGLITTPWVKPVFTGQSNGSPIYGGITAGTGTLANGVPEVMDWIRENTGASIRCLVTNTVGAAPTVVYSLNGAAYVSASSVTVKAGDVVRWGILPTLGTTGSGTLSIQNRPEMNTRTYSFAP